MKTQSFFQVFLQSDQAGWDNFAQKLKNTNNPAIFDNFGIVKLYRIFGASGALPLGPPPEALYLMEGG